MGKQTDQEPIIILVNGSVLMTSSNGLANRALAVYMSHARTLADDVAFGSMWNLAGANSRGTLLVSVNRILAAVQASSQNPNEIAKWQGVFGGQTDGVVATTRFDGKNWIGAMFIPINWDKLVKNIADGTKQAMPPGAASPAGVS